MIFLLKEVPNIEARLKKTLFAQYEFVILQRNNALKPLQDSSYLRGINESLNLFFSGEICDLSNVGYKEHHAFICIYKFIKEAPIFFK